MNGFTRRRPLAATRARSTPPLPAPALAITAIAVALAGCVGYSSWPPQEGSNVPSNPNFNEMRLAMTAALAWTVDRYPPGPINDPNLDTPVAINLPDGVRESMYRIIVENVSDRAQPLTPENTHLPIYHITRVAVTGDDGTVDVARPVSGWGTDHPVYQGVTLELRGGMFKEWRVVGHRVWTPGAMTIPEYHFIPGSAPQTEEADEPAPPQPDPTVDPATQSQLEATQSPPDSGAPGDAASPVPSPADERSDAPGWD